MNAERRGRGPSGGIEFHISCLSSPVLKPYLHTPRGHAKLVCKLIAEREVGVLVSIEDVLQYLQLLGCCSFPLLLVEIVVHFIHHFELVCGLCAVAVDCAGLRDCVGVGK